MVIPFTTTLNTSSSKERTLPETPRTPSQSLKLRMSNIFSTPKRMSKRTKIPPPLSINELTPPATIKRMTYYEPSTSLMAGSSTSKTPTTPATNLNCSICQDSLVLRNGQSERILVLTCDHSCHWDCFLIGGDLNTGKSVCFECGGVNRDVRDKMVREEVLMELRETEELKITAEDRNPVEEEDLFIGLQSPHTPVNQIIRDEDILNKKETYARDSFLDMKNHHDFKMKEYTVYDLIKPNVNLLTEYSKYEVGLNQEYLKIGYLLNIFDMNSSSNFINNNNNNNNPVDDSIKLDIHRYMISLLSCQLVEEALNLDLLANLKLFDSYEISIDGENWEFTMNFLFGDSLLILNQSLTQIIGTVSIQEHLISISEILENNVIIVYLSTQTLPELHIKSSNKILLERWCSQLRDLKQDVSLIKMSTTLWSLVINSNVDLPTNIIKFNELTHSGLDLPFEMVKDILPEPTKMCLNLVVSVPLFNLTTDLEDEEYLTELKDTLLNIIDNLKADDKLGLILLGRDGSGNYGYNYSTYIGMIDKNYDGLWNLIAGLQLLDSISNVSMDMIMTSCFKSCHQMFLMNGIDGGSTFRVNKLMVLTNISIDYQLLEDKYLIELISQHDLCINEILITKSPTLPLKLFNLKIDKCIYSAYCQYQFESFKDFNDQTYQLVKKKFHEIYLNHLKIDLKINEMFKNVASIQRIEFNGQMIELQEKDDLKSLTLKTTEINSHKNIRFDVLINISKYQELTFPDSEISLLNINYFINNSKLSYHLSDQKIRISFIQNDEYDLNYSIDERDQFDQNDLIFLDIPLLPPLSSFKDSIFVKRDIELYLISELNFTKDPKDIEKLISVVWGLSRGCSSNYLNYWYLFEKNDSKGFEGYLENFIMKGLKSLLQEGVKSEKICKFINLLIEAA